MHIDLAALPDDVATLHRMIGELATTLDSERVRAHAEIDRLRQIVKALRRFDPRARSSHWHAILLSRPRPRRIEPLAT
jgi:hypothetical protein